MCYYHSNQMTIYIHTEIDILVSNQWNADQFFFYQNVISHLTKSQIFHTKKFSQKLL